MHQCLCPAVTEMAYLRRNNPKIALFTWNTHLGWWKDNDLEPVINKKNSLKMCWSYSLRWFSLDEKGRWCWYGRSRTHCGEPLGSGAARRWWTLPLMPPPADLECVAPLRLKIAQSQNRPEARRRVEGREGGRGDDWGSKLRGLPAHRLPGVMVWKTHNVTECVLLCVCSVKGEDRGSEGVDEMIT